MSFSHYLITRFNIPLKNATTHKGIDSNWLTHRFELFETYCLPSVAGQVNLNFTWLVFFDMRTPEIFKRKIQKLTKLYPFFKPVYLSADISFKTSLKEEITAHLSPEKTHVITSRLDNDDALHEEYMDEVQKMFNHQDGLYIDIRCGYSLQVKPDVLLARIDKVMNPFASLIESRVDFVSILDRDHDAWGGYKKRVVYQKKALWVQIVHDGNLLNQFGYHGYLVSKGYLVRNLVYHLQAFNIYIKKHQQLSPIKRLKYNLKVAIYQIKRILKSEVKLLLKST